MNSKIYLSLLIGLTVVMSCSKMYDNIEKYAGEKVYPGKYDTIIGRIGFERVEIDLMKAGRIPASQVKLGKAVKTIVEYDDKKIVLDTLASWLNIKDLKVSKLYRFRVYTQDDEGNISVPQQIALIPYTQTDLANLVITSPQALTSPSAAIFTWPGSLTTALVNYYGLKYSYKDKSGVTREGERAQNPRVLMSNLNAGTASTIDFNYKVIPKVNGVAILDTVWTTRTVQVNTPVGSASFTPTELGVLNANGLSNFIFDAAAAVQKLTFPIHTTTLQDLFYFPGVKEIDLTGGSVFQMTTNSYNRNGVIDTIGRGPFVPFARRVGDMPATSTQFLLDLLDLGTLTKVKYAANSMGIDAQLAPYVSRGLVEIVGKPDEALIPLSPFLLDGVVQDANWKLDVEISPATFPAGTGLQNVLKATMRAKNGTLVIQIPKEYEFDVAQYKSLKFKVYGPPKSVISGTYAPYNRLWMRIMNYSFAFTTESSFGQQYWEYSKDAFTISDASLQTWTDMTVDLSQSVGKHNRVIVINIGGEPSLTFAPTQDIVYYFANFRFSK
jgi:hypothetical protein